MCIHIYIYIHKHTFIYIYIYIYTYTYTKPNPLAWGGLRRDICAALILLVRSATISIINIFTMMIIVIINIAMNMCY